MHFATGKTCTNVKADLMVIQKALLHIRDEPVNQVVILRLPNCPPKTQGDVKDALTHDIIHALTLSVPVVTLQWIPAHCQVHGNEVADALAKSGGQAEQVERPTSYLKSRL